MINIFLSVSFVLMFAPSLTVLSAQPSGPAVMGFELQDFLGRHWQNESVTFPLSSDQLKSAQARSALVGRDDKPVPYQIISSATSTTPMIEFLADIEPYETRTYRFTQAVKPAAGDIHVAETRDVIQLQNSRVGIALRKRLAKEEGPIERIRLASGKWIGNSLLKNGQNVTSYSAEVVAQGPAFAEVLCAIKFAQDQEWKLRFRIQANEPVILVDEIFALSDAASFVLLLNQSFAPTNLFYRYGMSMPGQDNAVGRLATFNISSGGKEPLFMLEPWLHWWERQRQGTWFALYNDKDTDLLAIGAREPSVWVDPNQKQEMRPSIQLPLSFDEGSLRWTLPLKNGARKWIIAALDKDASLEPLKRNQLVAPLPQQYLIKHSDFPLNRIKDYVLKWSGDETDHPRLIVKESDVAKWRARFLRNPARLSQLSKAPLSEQQMDEPIAYYLGTADRELGKHLTTTAVEWVQSAVDMFLRQDALVSFGFAPHHQSRIFTAMNLADVIWSSAHVSPEMRERLKAQLAFLAYAVNRADYWSPERGFSANPNMTTTVAAFRAMLGCMLSAHPLARVWVSSGMSELKDNQLDRWSDEGGGWLEAPHYTLVSYDHLIGAFMAAYNAGFNEYLYHPRMKKVIEWLAKISTPRDSASLGRRHLLPIGNTYMREPSGEFGIVAYLWKDRDPEFASEMQWMYVEQGAYSDPGVGGFFPSLAGYRKILKDDTIPPKFPAYQTEWFPRTGVILRSHFPSDRETQLHLIAGTNHAHYDRDSGSFTLWGKGRIIANDFGYYGNAPGEDHNMVVGPSANDGAIMHITHFQPGDNVDYVRGIKNNSWERQIVLVKDHDPLGPNYFVISDSLNDGSSGTWRTWFAAQMVTPGRHGALIQGMDDVDTDVFILKPKAIAVTVQEKTLETWGVTVGKYGRVSTTQTGLVAPLNNGDNITAIFYPRLKAEKQPVFTPLADGNGVKIETDAGTDYVFLGVKPFTFREQTITFEGTVGAVLARGKRTLLWLGQRGSIAVHGAVLREDLEPAAATE
jgi:hypothetical protein